MLSAGPFGVVASQHALPSIGSLPPQSWRGDHSNANSRDKSVQCVPILGGV